MRGCLDVPCTAPGSRHFAAKAMKKRAHLSVYPEKPTERAADSFFNSNADATAPAAPEGRRSAYGVHGKLFNTQYLKPWATSQNLLPEAPSSLCLISGPALVITWTAQQADMPMPCSLPVLNHSNDYDQ